METVVLTSEKLRIYRVFVASPGDMKEERQAVRAFFDRYNHDSANPRGLEFKVIGWPRTMRSGWRMCSCRCWTNTAALTW